MSRKSRFSEEDYSKMKSLYLEGLSTHKIGKLYGVTGGTVYDAFKTRGFILRKTTDPKIYKLNDNIFKVIDSEQKAYWLGFLFADGCITKSKCLKLWLKQEDWEHIELFKAFLESNHPVVIDSKRKAIGINISSRVLCDSLVDVGCALKKTLNLEMPNLSKELLNHFIRGFFDGDGSVYWGKGAPTISFIGNTEFLNKIAEIIFLDTNAEGRIFKHSKSKAMYLVYTGQFKVYAVYRWMYYNASIYLNRKKSRFDSYPQGKRLNYPTAKKYIVF